jgi:DNA-binding GntR family transcriptional regulator
MIAKGRPASALKIKRPSGKRKTVQNEVLSTLRTALMAGALVPGQVMSLRKLAASFGTSPMPVRAALMQLVAAGALEEGSNRSVRVPLLSKSRMIELFEIRVMLEGMAGKLACERGSPKLVDKLTKINKELLSAIAKYNVQDCLHANQKFHFTLYEASESEVLMPLIESLWLQCGPALYYSLRAPGKPWDAAIHVQILESLRRQKPSQVEAAVVRDVRFTAKNLLIGLANGSTHNALNASIEF